MKKLLAAVTLVGLVLLVQGTAQAVPILQLYIEGAVYDDTTESWVWDPSLTEGPPRLWAIGNTSGPGGAGDILDVRLAVAYGIEDSGLIVTLTPSTTDDFGGFTDPSPSPAVTQNANPIQTSEGPFSGGIEVTNGGWPVLTSGKELPTHGEYGINTRWQEFSLGDFTLWDSPVADFIDSFPAPLLPLPGGQINVYDVSLEEWSGGAVHFDLYDSVQGTKAKFAPFSHDATAQPEPASFIIWFLIGISWVGSAWTHQYRRRWRKWQQEEAAAAAGTHGDDQSARLPADQTEAQVGGQSAGSTAAG